MSTIELELFNALRKVNVPEEDARKVADAMNRSIDERYKVHAAVLATKADLAEMESRLVKWIVATVLGGSAFFSILSKFIS